MTESGPVLAPAQERLAIAALALAAFVVAVNVNLVGPLMPFLAEDRLYAGLSSELSKSRIGELLWTTSAAAALASLVLGPVVDRSGRRGPMVVGAVLFAFAMAGHALVDSHGLLLVMRIASGIGGGLVFTSASAAVADLVSYERRGAAMGVFSLGLFLAIPLGLPVGTWISSFDAGAWRWAFALLSLPGLLAVVAFYRFLPASLGRSDQRVSQLEVLRSRYVAPALASVLLYTGAFFIAVQLAPSWLDESGLVPKNEQWVIWVILGFGMAAGGLVLPRIADRVGKRLVVLLTTAGVGICLMVMTRVDSVAGLWVVGVPLALLSAARTPSLQALMSEIVPPRMRGTVMGMRAFAVNLGTTTFGAMGSEIYASHGYERVLLVATIGIVLAYLLVSWGVRVKL